MNKFFLLLLLSFCSFFTTSFLPASDLEGGDKACLEYIPTAISPNGDGINDEFEIRFSCHIGDYLLEIYDGSNQLVYQSLDKNESWNGQNNGRPVPEGYYSWIVRYKSSSDSREEREEGELALVR